MDGGATGCAMSLVECQRRQEFVAAVNRICEDAGGSCLQGRDPAIWELDTKAGKLHVCAIDSARAPWIWCRFLEPRRAALAVEDVNSCSGKWDFRLWEDWRRRDAPDWNPAFSTGLQHFAGRLRLILTSPVRRRPP